MKFGKTILFSLIHFYLFFALVCGLNSCSEDKTEKVVTVFLIGDSTVADYTIFDNYETERFPVAGWGQVFQPFMAKDSLPKLHNLFRADSVRVDSHARGGRSTRTFFQEGRWRAVYEQITPGDLVMMQFGHNDAAVDRTERYVDIEGYKEFLRLFVTQTRQQGGVPVLLTPVNRNYPWNEGVLTNVHGEYPQAVKDIATELDVFLIDLTGLSCDFFTSKGHEYVHDHYFMNLPAGVYPAYPDGQKDNTHFQPEGATEVARLIFEAMQKL